MTTTTILDNAEFELDSKIQFTVAEDALGQEGINAISKYLKNLNSFNVWMNSSSWADHDENVYDDYIKFPEDWSWQWVVKGKHVYVGTLPKRISKYMKKTFDITLTAQECAIIGNLAAQYSQTKDTYIFDVTGNFDWRAGTFGEYDTSCWFDYSSDDEEGEPKSYKEKFRQLANGLAIRFYKPYGEQFVGYARAWLSREVPNCLMIFNGYGMESSRGATLPIARILASYLGLSYKLIRLSSGTVHINGNEAYLIGTPETLAYVDSHKFRWAAEAGKCVHCDKELYYDDSYRSLGNGRVVCSDCFNESYYECSCCGQVKPNDETPTMITRWSSQYKYCKRCTTLHTKKCSCCDTLYITSDMHYMNGSSEYICSNCRSVHNIYCGTCRITFVPADLGSDGNCKACTAKKEAKRVQKIQKQELEQEEEFIIDAEGNN